MRRFYLAAALAVGAAACSDAPSAPSHPSLAVTGAQGTARYIVRFRDTERNESREADRLVRDHGGRLVFTYHAAIKGFAGDFSPQAITALAQDPVVIAVEPDQIAHAIGTQLNPPSWGLDRVDQHPLPLDQSYTYNATGTGVRVYIIDTGIWFTHVDFGGRAVTGVDEITPGGTATDCFGHGTHVAGTVGGSTYGLAKNVTLVAVRVLDCTGSGAYTQVIAGVDWVTQQKQANPNVPMAANMSLGGPVSSTLNAAVTNSIAAGVTYAVAAGNSNTSACNSSPSSTPNAITVGATTITDARASFSNFGTCVDIFAPGQSITSDWYTSNTATNTISGTSMATPHVAGAAALYLELNPTASPATVTSALKANATANVVTNPGTGSPNLLLYTGFIGGAPPPPPPVAAFTFSCSGLTCNFDGSGSTAQPNATYAWRFKEGATGTGQITSYTFSASGTYNVRLTVTDAGGTSIVTHAVTVSGSAPPPPVANFTFSCTNLACSFDGSSSTAQSNATYTWTWGDGTANGTGKTASHTYGTANTYSVTLTVSDAGGTNSKTQSVTVTSPPPPPVAAFTYSCTNLACSFDGSGSTAQSNATYGWSWGDGTANGSGKTPTHTYGAGGTYSVTLTVTDAGGTDTETQSVTVTSPPPPPPVASFTFSCTSLACSFDGSGSTAQSNATYGWAWDDGTANGSGQTATHTYVAPGTYNVTLTVTDAGGTSSVTHAVSPTVPAPVANFTFSCTGLGCNFDGSSSTAQSNATYGWSWGDGTANGSGKTASHTYAAGGTYSVTLTVTDAGGSSTKTLSVTVSSAPPPPVANYTFSCVARVCTFDGSSSTAQSNATYAWRFGDDSGASGKIVTHTYATAGTRNVRLTVTDAGGTSTKIQSVTVP